MAKCRQCGCRYNEKETADRLWSECGFWNSEAFDGCCFDCACAMYEGFHGHDPRAGVEDMDEDELAEFNSEIEEFKGLWLLRKLMNH